MNPAKWDEFAEAFARGDRDPANGWEAWAAQAVREAITIREALPETVQMLVEVGSGIGRLTPYLALQFPRVVAIDTSPACRVVTQARCQYHPNVIVEAPQDRAQGDAAVVWGNLYDDDWTPAQAEAHRADLRRWYPLVLEGNSEGWALYVRP